VFLHAMRKLDQLREPQAFAGWLRQITVRMAINRLTRRGPMPEGGERRAGGCGGHDHQPARQPDSVGQATELYAALEQLKPIDRATLVAFYCAAGR